jgi:hypothetical protein
VKPTICRHCNHRSLATVQSGFSLDSAQFLDTLYLTIVGDIGRLYGVRKRDTARNVASSLPSEHLSRPLTYAGSRKLGSGIGRDLLAALMPNSSSHCEHKLFPHGNSSDYVVGVGEGRADLVLLSTCAYLITIN